jgi:hypothetical protein
MINTGTRSIFEQRATPRPFLGTTKEIIVNFRLPSVHERFHDITVPHVCLVATSWQILKISLLIKGIA